MQEEARDASSTEQSKLKKKTINISTNKAITKFNFLFIIKY